MDFSSVSHADLSRLIGLREVVDDSEFERWRENGRPPSESEQALLEEIVSLNRINIESYTEDEIKVHVIGPLMAVINFHEVGLKSWYHRKIETVLEGDEKIGGYVDFILAPGDKAPEAPYFLLQEFKVEFSDANPEPQLLAEMAAAARMGAAAGERVYGAYLNAGLIRLVVYRHQNSPPDYCVSKAYDLMDIGDLTLLFKNLYAIKRLKC